MEREWDSAPQGNVLLVLPLTHLAGLTFSMLLLRKEAKQLKEHVESSGFKSNISKYPAKKKELEEFANNLTIFDNPVLMFVTFKK